MEKEAAELVALAAAKSGKTTEELLTFYEKEISPEYAKELRRLLNEQEGR